MNKINNAKEILVRIPVNNESIEGNLVIPAEANGIVLFAHGSGSSRFSPRNNRVAREINDSKIATLLIDLLTNKEEVIDNQTAEFRFNIDLLAKRLGQATQWLQKNQSTSDMNIGYFGSSTGTAAALISATEYPKSVKAVVSRGGRPDLAEGYLQKVQSPSLLIVGGNDPVVLNLNKKALEKIPAKKRLAVVPGATHLFEETGKLEEVSKLAIEWFLQHLRK